VFLPLSAHESRRLFASPFNPSRGTVRAFPTFVSTMPSADFCRTIRAIHITLSRESATYGRSPEVSTTAFRAQGPDLHLTLWMDMDFAIRCSLVQRSCLISGSCSSPRAFARRCLRTPFCIGALALCCPSPPSGWGKTFTSKLSYMLGTHQMTATRSKTEVPAAFGRDAGDSRGALRSCDGHSQLMNGSCACKACR